MQMARKFLGISIVSLFLLLVPFGSTASAAGRGVAYYPNYGWGWGGPWGGYGWSYYSWPYYYWDNSGVVRLKNASSSDDVFINGSYAGKVKKLRTMYLDPGSYTISVRNGRGQQILNQQVYVVTGKTIKLQVNDKEGTIKLEDTAENDKVYVNGSYKGEADDLKSLKLSPGTYRIQIMNDGRSVMDQKVNLPTDETVRLAVRDRN